MILLYHYVHCPFCLRVRMALGFFQISYHSKVLPYDDEKTPLQLAGKKMLPILEDNNTILNESLDIIKHIDTKDVLNTNSFLCTPDKQQSIDDLLGKIGAIVHPLAMPYWIYTPEFDQASREYFQKKKEAKRGPFKNLVKNKEKYLSQLESLTDSILNELKPYYESQEFSIKDILIASHLWGLYIVPEVNLHPRLHRYLQKIKSLTNFDYHHDYWT